MAGTSLATLLHDLTSLRQALEREDYGTAGDVLAHHDQRLREFIDTVGRHAPMQALRGMLQLQHLVQADDARMPGGSS